MNILITICGRAGSKGVKSKNFKEFLGHPLIYYSLRTARSFQLKNQDIYHTDIVVSTDSAEILQYSRSFEEVVGIQRPAELARDDTPKVPVIQDAVYVMEGQKHLIYDYVVDLDITSPLRKVSDMEQALDKCRNSGGKFDLVFSAVAARRNPYFNMVEIDGEGLAHKVKDSSFACRQQAPAVYDMNASIYCYNRDALCNKLKRITFEGNSGMILMEDRYVIDIDREQDFEILELLVKAKYGREYPELFDCMMD